MFDFEDYLSVDSIFGILLPFPTIRFRKYLNKKSNCVNKVKNNTSILL